MATGNWEIDVMQSPALILGLGLALAAGAAQAAEGPYVSGRFGISLQPDSDLQQGGLAGELDYESGAHLGAALGYAMPTGLRVEGELTARSHELDHRDGPGGRVDARGDIGSVALMANLFYDIPTGGRLLPYVGGGIGIAGVAARDWVFNRTLVLDEEEDAVLAWQLGAGVGYRVTGGLVFLGYRYFATQDPELDNIDGNDFELDYRSHDISVGYRYEF